MKNSNIKLAALISALLLAGALLSACGNDANRADNGNTEAKQSVQADVEAADTEGTEASHASDKVASASDMTDVEEVVADWMEPVTADALNDGVYHVTVDSSSSMFSIQSCELTVADGQMTAVMTMGGTGYRYLYMGTAEEAAEAPEDAYIPYVEDADGAHTFTVPVEALDQGIACAAFSNKKELWYPRTLVFRADSLQAADGSGAEPFREDSFTTAASLGLADGEYRIDVQLNGGSGKASVESPAKLTVADGQMTAEITWSSPNYDYMLVRGERYEPVNTEGNSVFEIPVAYLDRNYGVIADTTAMSKPYEISYSLYFDSGSVSE